MAEIVIETRCGLVKGVQNARHQDFLGIRYAQAPVGVMRFQPPQRIDQWEGIFDATRYAPAAPQAYPDTPLLQLEESEDCLSLNIYTPAADAQHRPVMVFIHGGGFLIDSGSRPRTYGGPLADTGNVVVVTIEYRMGAFGFLAMEGISPNLGLQDQVCALEWVQRTIASFGGDPENVTIFGESAGATSVAYLMVMSSARGLFHKAILESGAFPFESLGDNRRFAAAGTHKFLKALKVKAGDVDALQNASYDRILAAQKKAAGRLLFDDRAFYPVIDGAVIPEDIYGALRSSHERKIPIIIGVNAEELPLFGAFLKPGIQQTIVRQVILKNIRKLGVTRKQIGDLLALYRQQIERTASANREINFLFSDSNFRIPEILFAEAHLAAENEVYFYCFTHPAPGVNAAMHVMELYFVFGSLGTDDMAEIMQMPGTEGEHQLSKAMMNAWTAFARSGNPNHSGLPRWEKYDLQQRATMQLDIQSRMELLPQEAIRKVWMEIIG